MTATLDLEVLFRREYPKLVRALAISGGCVDDAADAVQDAFAQAGRHWSRISRYDDPAAWIRRVAINRLANRERSRRRLAGALHRLPPPGGDTDSYRDLDLAKAIAALPPQQRMAVCLFYVADLPVAEVANAMGLAQGTVKSHLHDARAHLATQLEVNDG